MPYERESTRILARWREVERQLLNVEEGSLDAEGLQAEALLLRNEYAALVDAAPKDDQAGQPLRRSTATG
jgi:hypothetical protein